jgi:antirestriction protein ArdC
MISCGHKMLLKPTSAGAAHAATHHMLLLLQLGHCCLNDQRAQAAGVINMCSCCCCCRWGIADLMTSFPCKMLLSPRCASAAAATHHMRLLRLLLQVGHC